MVWGLRGGEGRESGGSVMENSKNFIPKDKKKLLENF
jgi:hypothetical protein